MNNASEELRTIFYDIEMLELIGTGGQKKVYKGFDKEYGDVVIKIIELSDENTLKRAMRELEIASLLEGDEYPQVFEFKFKENEGKKYLYILEEYIKGVTLREYISKNNCLPLDKVLNIGVLLLKALAKVHSKKLVHRDIKPENIIIYDEKITLLDFGIARDLSDASLTADFAFFGPMTLGYAAPEQIKNQKKIICNRTDLFSWGIIMFELFNGYNPFTIGISGKEDIILHTLNKVAPDMNSGNYNLDRVVEKCLEKSVHRRPQSCEFILNLLME